MKILSYRSQHPFASAIIAFKAARQSRTDGMLAQLSCGGSVHRCSGVCSVLRELEPDVAVLVNFAGAAGGVRTREVHPAVTVFARSLIKTNRARQTPGASRKKNSMSCRLDTE